MINVLVIGKDSQLARCIKDLEASIPNVSLSFFDSKALDITNIESVKKAFKTQTFDYCINCAAYTNVDKAESEPEKAYAVNATGVFNLSKVCKVNNTILIHLSTDFVFDGKKTTPYTEEDIPNPINVYGKSKYEGEKEIQKILEHHFIIRTSWLYSEYGHNFVKTILRLAKEKDEINIVSDQIGSPTYAGDLAKFILNLIDSESTDYGIFHYSNEGEATWFDFGYEILKVSGKIDDVKLKKTDYYPTFANRPSFSVLSKEKINKKLGIHPSLWKNSLYNEINNIKNS